MHPALRSVAHRPWPLPAGPWVMTQTWHDLLFVHWPIPVDGMRALVPAQLEVDPWQGQCWIGVVPFWMSGVRVRGLLGVPGATRFPELNVRTYVTHGGKPGVYFFSLDAASSLAVKAARTFYHLPYFHAQMRTERRGDEISYSSVRNRGDSEFVARYQPVAPVELRRQGTIEHWLSERYCLYTVHHGVVYRGEVHHEPWPLQDAEAHIERNTMAAAAGFDLPNTSPLLHFARRLDVLIWPLRSLAP
jgi:uncharacterized protein YqjF (DUF2071 family)